jgi:CBS domain-containing protein
MMAEHRVHAIVVMLRDREDERRPWGVVSDLDLMHAAAQDRLDDPASAAAEAPVVLVRPEWSLSRAAKLMSEHRSCHLLVVDGGMHPLGIVSALDIAGSLGGRPTRPETA